MSFPSSLNALRSKLNSSSLSDDELIHEILTQARINASGLPPSQRDSSLSLLLQVTDEHGRGLLNYSCGYGREGVAKFILQQQGTIFVDSRDIHGDTPLHRAARFNHTAIIRLLVSYNANIELKDKQNQTPLFLAACTRKQSAAVELIKNGAELVVDGVSLWCAMEKSRYSGGFAKIQELKRAYERIRDQIKPKVKAEASSVLDRGLQTQPSKGAIPAAEIERTLQTYNLECSQTSTVTNFGTASTPQPHSQDSQGEFPELGDTQTSSITSHTYEHSQNLLEEGESQLSFSQSESRFSTSPKFRTQPDESSQYSQPSQTDYESQSQNQFSMDIRKRFPADWFRADDGHYVRSKAEALIDNFLYRHRIAHEYKPSIHHPTRPSQSILLDWYLPEYNIYIEYFGISATPSGIQTSFSGASITPQQQKEYQLRASEKKRLYKQLNIDVVFLDEHDIKCLDVTLGKKLVTFGVELLGVKRARLN